MEKNKNPQYGYSMTIFSVERKQYVFDRSFNNLDDICSFKFQNVTSINATTEATVTLSPTRRITIVVVGILIMVTLATITIVRY